MLTDTGKEQWDRRQSATRTEIEPSFRATFEQPVRRLDRLDEVALDDSALVAMGNEVRGAAIPIEQEACVVLKLIDGSFGVSADAEQVRRQLVPRLLVDQDLWRDRAGALSIDPTPGAPVARAA